MFWKSIKKEKRIYWWLKGPIFLILDQLPNFKWNNINKTLYFGKLFGRSKRNYDVIN